MTKEEPIFLKRDQWGTFYPRKTCAHAYEISTATGVSFTLPQGPHHVHSWQHHAIACYNINKFNQECWKKRKSAYPFLKKIYSSCTTKSLHMPKWRCTLCATKFLNPKYAFFSSLCSGSDRSPFCKNDIFLCSIPMFHVYGLASFGFGLLCSGTRTVLMQQFDFQGMLEAIHTYKVNNIPTVTPVILGLVKYNRGGYDLSSSRSVGSGAALLSKHVAHGFRAKFPWDDLKPEYGLTESCGPVGFFISSEEAKARSAASGGLLLMFSVNVVDY
ncbi:AMP-binding, conserved site-containing protein [Artemisia annua]|uniref:AMP-binding, conserved site-containing protein n=1 Tax=Artemisia annua TaxID=35608 RepID=A0A2U1NVZ2_ARTAN|nr:AMP-binding, conserved site-containing protein [Artemisia annua]